MPTPSQDSMRSYNRPTLAPPGYVCQNGSFFESVGRRKREGGALYLEEEEEPGSVLGYRRTHWHVLLLLLIRHYARTCTYVLLQVVGTTFSLFSAPKNISSCDCDKEVKRNTRKTIKVQKNAEEKKGEIICFCDLLNSEKQKHFNF